MKNLFEAIAVQFANLQADTETLQYENAILKAKCERLESHLIDRQVADLNAEALAEIKATVDGHSDQPVKDIIYGLLAELAAIKRAREVPPGKTLISELSDEIWNEGETGSIEVGKLKSMTGFLNTLNDEQLEHALNLSEDLTVGAPDYQVRNRMSNDITW